MAGESVVLDPVSESPSNVQLDLNDQVSYFLLAHDYPAPDLDPLYASSPDTDGDIFVSSRARNRVITAKVRVMGSSALDLDTKLDYIAQKVGKLSREGGTYKRTTPSGLSIVFDVLPETTMPTVVFDKKYISRWKSEVDLRFVCAPAGRGAEIGTVLDDFSTDSIGAGKYTFDAGSGTISVSGGQLVPSTTAEKRFYRSAEGVPTYGDVQATVTVTTGASVASGSTGFVLKRAGANDYLRATLNFAGAASTLTFEKVVAGVATQLGPASATFTPVAATSYWPRVRVEGNKLTVEYWTTAPTPTGSPTASLVYTLAGADATLLGLGIAGSVGLRLLPQATDYRWDGFQIDPYLYVETTNPILVTPPIYGIKGDLPARTRLIVQELASQDQWWAIWGNESEYFSQGVPTILDQFATDTIGSGAWSVVSGTVSISGGLLVPGATTEIRMHRTDAATYTDGRLTVKTTTGASVASGSTAIEFRRIADTDFLFARLNFAGAASTLTLHKRTAGTDSGALATSAAFTTAAATAYWLRFTVKGKTLKVEAFATDPETGSAIITGATATYTLTDAEFAIFSQGGGGLKLVPQATDWRWDDFRIAPWAGCTWPEIKSEELVVDDGTTTYSGVYATRAGATTLGTVANHVVRGTVVLAYQAICAIMPRGNVGSYRVFARTYRPTTNAGQVSVALEWGTGDGVNITRNDVYTFAVDEREGDFAIIDLGKIQIPPATKGSQQWQGRIIAKSTVLSDVLDIDYVWLEPYAEGSGEASAALLFQNPAGFAARDEFNQAAANLGGLALPIGGTWATSGSITDLAVNATSHTVQRATTSDTGERYAIPSLGAMTAQAIQIDFQSSTVGKPADPIPRLLARWTDANNHYAAGLDMGRTVLMLDEVVAGVTTRREVNLAPAVVANTWYTMRLQIDTAGRYWVWFFQQGGAPALVASGRSSTLATGGSLASGQVGFSDIHGDAAASTRNYDNFFAFAPTADAAIFAGRQMEFRYDSAVRQNPDGSIWVSESSYEGDFATLLPAGRENRQNRVVIDMCRNDPDTMTDPSTSKIQAQFIHAPRYLVVPAP